MKNPKIRVSKTTINELVQMLMDKGVKPSYLIFGAKVSFKVARSLFDKKPEYLTVQQVKKIKWAIKHSARCKKIALDIMREQQNKYGVGRVSEVVNSASELFKKVA